MSASRRPVTGSGKRALVALAMGAITSPLLIGLTAGSASAAVDITTACPEDAFDDAGFTDIADQNEQFQLAINCLAALGITTGQTSTTFNPTGSITRAQFSQFLFRLGNGLEELGVFEGWDTDDAGFEDLGGVSAEARNAINALRNAGVVNGRTATTFEPLAQVRRDQMATFLAQFMENVVGEELPGTVTNAFDDDNGNVHEANINAIAAADIADGVAPRMYAPNRPVTRAEMAAFVARHIQVLINEDIIPPLFDDGGTDEPGVELTTEGDIMAGATIAGLFANLPEGATVTVTGAGFEAEAVEVDAEGAFELTLAEDLEAGEQTLVFTITLEDGTEFTVELTFTVIAPATQPNETLTFGPDEAATIELTGDTSDSRGYLATGLNNDLVYRVTLVNADTITVDENGFVTFTNATGIGEEGFADTGADIADILQISNGTVDGSSNTATATPVNGAITVTIEGDARGSVVPVIYVNGGAAGNTPAQGGMSPRLELDANGVPTEPFGIAGVTTFTAPQAQTANDDLRVNVGVDEVNREANTFIGDPDGADAPDNGDEVFFAYDANDTFTITTTGGGTVQATLAMFEAALSVGDNVDVTNYQRNAELRSTFNVNNVDPAAPTVTATDANDTNVVLTLGGVGQGNTVRVYGRVDSAAEVTTAAPVLATATADQVPDVAGDASTSGFQVVVRGLTAETTYDFAVSQVEGDEESALTQVPDVTTTPTQVSPRLVSSVLTTDAPLEGRVGANDVLTFTFNRGLALGAAGEVNLAFRDADGDTFLVSNVAAPGPGETDAGDFITRAAIGVSDVVTGTDRAETLTVTIREAAEDRNAAGNGTIDYPVTLTAISGVTDDPTGGNATLEGGDVTLP